MGPCGAIRQPWFPVAMLSFLSGCCRVGLYKLMGILFSDLQRSIQMDSVDLGVMFGLFSVVGLLLTPFVSAIHDRKPRQRFLFIIGAFWGSVAIVLASFATRTIHLFVTFAIAGIGQSMVLITTMNSLHRLTGDKFNLIFGLSSCGYSLGIVLFPFLGEILLAPYGWRGCLLIMGGLSMQMIPCAVAIRIPTKAGTRSRNGSDCEELLPQGTFNISEKTERVSPFDHSATGSDLDNRIKDVISHDPNAVVTESTDKPSTRKGSINMKIRDLLEHVHNFCVWLRTTELYSDPVVIFIFLCEIILSMMYIGWHAFLIPHAEQRGVSQQRIVILTLLTSVGNMCGRLVTSLLTHRLTSPVTLYLILTILNVVSLAFDVLIPSYYVMLVTACCSAVSVAGRSSLQPLVARDRFSPQNVGMAFGIYCVCTGVGGLLGGYLMGRMNELFSSYDASFTLLGAIDVLTFIFMLVVKLVKKPKSPHSHRIPEDCGKNDEGE